MPQEFRLYQACPGFRFSYVAREPRKVDLVSFPKQPPQETPRYLDAIPLEWLGLEDLLPVRKTLWALLMEDSV